MIIQQMRGAELEKFFSGGYAYLAINKENVNALNVFPVPDGDTGINMALTMGSAVKKMCIRDRISGKMALAQSRRQPLWFAYWSCLPVCLASERFF